MDFITTFQNSSYLKLHILSLNMQLLTIFSNRQFLSYPCLNFLFTHQRTKTLFYAVYFTPLCSNLLYLFTPLLNLCPLIFGLTPCGLFICIYLRLFFLREHCFLFTPFWLTLTLLRRRLWCKTKPWLILWWCIHNWAIDQVLCGSQFI
jgi:hypothetical protein